MVNSSYNLYNIMCPTCKTNDAVIPIVYGYPTIHNLNKASLGEIVLGGCMFNDAKWFCKKDQTKF